MLDAIKPLLDSDLITEETRMEINEAWETKLNEAREQARVELREEFAQRYEHDKSVMVEALDKMVTEGLAAEIQAVAAEKQALAEDRVRFQRKMNESATKFNGFLVSKLAEEIGELRKDRKMHTEGLAKLENFMVHAKESADKMSQAVSRHLKAELTQLQEDIKVARENNFGRRIFEAYASEFGATHLNEKAEVRKLYSALSRKDQQLAEAIKLTQKAKVVVESKERELRMIKESNERDSTMEMLLSPLNKEKRDVMRNLLESVQTSRLKNAFEKYLPAVLEDRSVKASKVITENVSSVTGDKTVPTQNVDQEDRSNVIDLKRLAGL